MRTLALRVLVSIGCLVLATAGARAAESATPAEFPSTGPALARDGVGHLYLAAHADDKTVFLTQLGPAGGVLRTTALDGFAPDAPLALAVSPLGEAVVVGAGGGDALIVRVAVDGRTIVSRTVFGGKALDAALAVAIDADGNAWVAGRTASADLPAEGALAGTTDAFLAELDPAGSVLFATYLGGPEADEARGVAFDKEGAVYVTGSFGADAFLAKLAPKSGTLVYVIPFGGSRDDAGVAVAVTPSGDVMIAGTTRSADLPILSGPQGALGGESDAFVASFDAASGALVFSTYLGGAEDERALALAVDRKGAAWVAGTRGKHAVAWRLAPDASGSIRTELLAGDSDDLASGVVLDGNGDAWVAGLTRSQELAAVSRPERALGGDVFLTRFASGDKTPLGACPGTKTFTGGVSSAWGIAANWSGGTLPLATDDVCISGFDVTIASGSQVAGTLHVQSGSLTINGGTLTVDGDSEIVGPLTVSGVGTLTGAGNLTVGGLFSWAGGTLSGTGTVTTIGTASVSSSNPKTLARIWNANGDVTWTGTGVVSAVGGVINNGSTWDCQGTTTLSGGSFNNSGTVKKSAGAGTTTVSAAFVNSGSVAVATGTLDIAATSSSTGSFDVSSGATLQFSAGFNVNAGTTFTGAGTVSPFGAGTLSINTPITMPASLTVAYSSGTITGAATLTIDGTFNWSGGSMVGGGVTTCNGPVNLSGATGKQLQVRTLNLIGGAVVTGTGAFSASFGAVINSPATFDWQSDAALSAAGGGTPVFNNSGTFKKSAGTGTTTITTGFVNTGAVRVASGIVSMAVTGSSTGSFNVSAGCTLEFAGGAMTLNAGTGFMGTGNVALSAGQLIVVGPVSMDAGLAFSMSGGTMSGTGNLIVVGPFNWSGGLLTSAGTTTCNGALTVSGTAALSLGQRILNVNAATTYTGTGTLTLSNGATINNNGTWDAQSDVTIAAGSGAASSFKNFGTFRKSAGAGTTTVQPPFTNSGTVDVQSGTVSAASYSQTAGTTKLTGGAFTSAANIAISGGSLAGSGTVSGPVVVSGTGALAPGLSAGTLSLGGAYTQQAPNGAFNVELGGLTPGTQYDRVDVTGAASLAGVLNVSLIGGFAPAPGDSFTIMTYASRTGTFTVNLPAAPCVDWQVSYGATALVLTAVAAAPPVEIAQLAATNATTLTWAAGSAAGIIYDVMRGDLGTLPVGPGAGETCLATGIATTTTSDSTPLAPGTGFWYVVRGRVAGCGTGTYGFATDGVERISTACP